MRIRTLDVGVESISEWQAEDEVHLPKEGQLAQLFLPEYRPLDEILRRPSLDERLPALLQPRSLDPDLLQPAALTDARVQVRENFLQRADRESGGVRNLFMAAAALLDSDAALDREVRMALAALLRG